MASGLHGGQHTDTEALFIFLSHGIAIVTKVLWTMPRATGVDSV